MALVFSLTIATFLQACGDGERAVPIEGPDQISTIVGDGYGFSGDGKPALDAKFSSISVLAVGDNGDIYIVDDRNDRIRKIDALTSIVDTMAGDGTTVYSGNGLLATSIGLDRIWDIAIDPQGDLFISGGDTDEGPSWFRYLGAETGTISTLLTQAEHRMIVDADSEGFGYVLGKDSQTILRADPITGDQEVLRLRAEIVNFTVTGPDEIGAFNRSAAFGEDFRFDSRESLLRLVRFDSVSMEKVEIAGPYPPSPFLMGTESFQLLSDFGGTGVPKEMVYYDEETMLVVDSGFPHIVVGKIDLNTGAGATVAGNGKSDCTGDGGQGCPRDGLSGGWCVGSEEAFVLHLGPHFGGYWLL